MGGRILIDVNNVISNLSSTSRTSCQTLALQFPQVYSPTETRETTQHSGGKNKHVMASDHTSLCSLSVTHSPRQRDKSNLSTPSTWPWGGAVGVGVGGRWCGGWEGGGWGGVIKGDQSEGGPLSEQVWPSGKALQTSVRYRFGSPFSSERLWFVVTVL